jgi:hypothetical protein
MTCPTAMLLLLAAAKSHSFLSYSRSASVTTAPPVATVASHIPMLLNVEGVIMLLLTATQWNMTSVRICDE